MRSHILWAMRLPASQVSDSDSHLCSNLVLFRHKMPCTPSLRRPAIICRVKIRKKGIGKALLTSSTSLARLSATRAALLSFPTQSYPSLHEYRTVFLRGTGRAQLCWLRTKGRACPATSVPPSAAKERLGADALSLCNAGCLVKVGDQTHRID